jgi:hypothetical protein
MMTDGAEWDIDAIQALRDMAEVLYDRKKAPALTHWVVANTLVYPDTDRQEMSDQLLNAHYELYGAPK